MKKLIFLISFIFINTAAAAASPDESFDAWLISNMKKYQIPGISIAVIKDYKIDWAKGYGMADVENSRPVNPDVIFQAASISKPVTAMAALKTVQDGKLTLDENVNVRLTSWKIPDNSYTKNSGVTLRELLSHSAGINISGFEGYAQGQKVPELLEVLNGKPPATSEPVRVISPIGKNFEYSGGGFVIVQQLLIDTYHKPFPEILNELVLAPLHMTNSRFQQPIADTLKNDIAIPYRPNYQPLAGGPHIYPELAAAGLWTTPSDLAKFVISIQKSLHDNPEVLSQKYAELMAIIPQSKLLAKTPEKNVEFGLGLIVKINKYSRSDKNGTYFAHGGQNEGFRNYIIGDTKTGNGIVIMTNMSAPGEEGLDDGWKFILAIIKKVADTNHWN